MFSQSINQSKFNEGITAMHSSAMLPADRFLQFERHKLDATAAAACAYAYAAEELVIWKSADLCELGT